MIPEFRAFVKDEKKMIPVICIDFTGTQIMKGYPSLIAYPDDGCYELKDVELMIHLGLRDKKKNKIFEGDILKIPVTGNQELHGEYAYHEVVYKNGVYITSYLKSEKENYVPRGYLGGFLLDHFDYDTKNFLFIPDYKPYTDAVVVGNIYENPEYLEDLE